MLKKQSGTVLIVSLMILISLTLLVLSATQSTLMQEKMTSAMRDAHISLEVAESGVRDAEEMIDALTSVTGFSDAGSGGMYSEGNGPADLFDDSVWSSTLTNAATGQISGLVSRYFVEYLGLFSVGDSLSNINVGEKKSTNGDVHGFKIVARSVGRDGNTERVIVSYYGKSF